MRNNIKQVKPNKRYHSGKINPESCTKLFESQKHIPIIYRSSYEKEFIYWLEHSRLVVHWGSECVGIPYENLADGTHHTYYPDYIIEMINSKDPDGKNIIVLVEVKPYKQTRRPDMNLPMNSYPWKEYIRNRSKWKAAQEFCDRNNIQFRIITEKTIQRLN